MSNVIGVDPTRRTFRSTYSSKSRSSNVET